MPHEVIMPALGMAQDTGQLVGWLKTAGDAVKAGDPIMEVETDKATMEVEAQHDGYLTNLRAKAGEDVPVGQVVAMISDSPEGTTDDAAKAGAPERPAPPPPSDAAPEDMPEGRSVIMPALGMAQDSALIIGWSKAPGDKVAADEPLLEVETDKSTMEVPAGFDGYLAAVLAAEGEDVPVGEVIALISADAPAKPMVRSRADGTPAARAPDPSPEPVAAKPPEAAPAAKSTPAPAASAKAPPAPVRPAPGGRILASPKARRIAAEDGLDLAKLVAHGVAQPFHMADLETLRALPDAAAATAPGPGRASQRLTATVPAKPLEAFLDWLGAETGRPADRLAVLAAFAAASLRDGDAPLTIDAEDAMTGARATLVDPDRVALGEDGGSRDDAGPSADLTLRDLTATAITGLHLGAEAVPVLSLAHDGEMLVATLEGAMDPRQAISLMTGFAGRLAEPLRHLL